MSPFVNYKVSPVPIPTDTHRPKSSLERGGSRSRASECIEEKEENVVTPPPPAAMTPEPEPEIVIQQTEEMESAKDKKRKPALQKRVKSSNSKKLETQFEEPKPMKDLPPPGAPPAGGLAPPTTAELGPDGLPLKSEENESIQEETDVPSPTKAWMDFDVFCKCFRTLYILHKPSTYQFSHQISDLKLLSVSPSTAPPTAKSDKKPLATTQPNLDGSSFYLYVDSVKPSEILVSFSVLPRWFEPPEDRKSVLLNRSKDKDIDKEQTNASISLAGSIVNESKAPPQVTPGTLVAEPHSWKSLIAGQPILRIRTTGIRSAMLNLPPGRHVLKLMFTSPLGHQVHMCSTNNFSLGDEDYVMPRLINESCRFKDNAFDVITNLGKCLTSFGDAETFPLNWKEFVNSHCPYLADKEASKVHHFQMFNASLYSMLRKALKDVISPELQFAWRAFNYDVHTRNMFNIPVGSRPESRAVEEEKKDIKATSSGSVRGSGKHNKKRLTTNTTISMPEANQDTGDGEKQDGSWTNREPTVDEHIAAVKIQKFWKGYYVRKIKRARTPGTDENAQVCEQLSKCWNILEQNMEELGLSLLRELFKLDPDLMPYYPFHKDEWNRIAYQDYRGTFPDQPSLSWFVVFRDIFYPREEMLVVPRVYIPINSCMLRVVDMDTGLEIPRVFHKVAPYVYKRNKKGYAFVAEARTVEQPLISGNWRIRLIGSFRGLPVPQSGEVCSSFSTKEIKDYYVPNPKNIIFRQLVKVVEDHLVSIQVNTSKPDVYIKLAVLDNEEEVISVVGKGHVVIPAFIFLKDITQNDVEAHRSSSRASAKGSGNTVKVDKTQSKLKRTESAVSNEQAPPSRSSMRSDQELAERLEENVPHKYVIQAMVLQNSWPLSESSWKFVQTLKEQEKEELKVANKEERAPSPIKVEKTASKSKSKAGKEKPKEKEKLSRPTSRVFDLTKPNWTLRVVSDAAIADEIEIKKDTGRADEIRAMKKAWEEAEPGRAAKALQSRMKYLNSHMIKLNPTEPSESKEDQSLASAIPSKDSMINQVTAMESISIQDDSLAASSAQPGTGTPLSMPDIEIDAVLTTEPPRPPTPKEILEELDLQPFLRKTCDTPRYLDEEEKQRQLEKRQKDIADYKAYREEVEKWREQDRQNRNKIKMQQLEQAQALQAALDAARDRVNIPREAIRQKYLEAEQQKQAELANQEVIAKQETEAKSPKGGKKSAKKKGK